MLDPGWFTRQTTGATTTDYTYDADGLLTAAGDLSITHDPQTGLTTAAGLENTATNVTYNTYGEPTSVASTHAPDASTTNNLYTATYTRDAASRITVKQEIRPSGTTTWAYNYDAAGRLVNVTKNGDQHAAYTYDANGNRTSKTVENQSTYATFDSRDRMNTQGDLDLTYDQNGEITEKRNRASSESLHLAYTASGDLKSATTPDGRQITYLLDGFGRRVGKKVDGNLTQGLIYSPDAAGPVAELDAQGNTRSRFVYAGGHAPAYMVKDSTTYRLITDQLGSVVMVADATTGAIAQEISYGPYGEVLSDSSPGFQPFGYAGGIFDSDTGLTHFGAREYDAELGRWSSSDPIGFGGGDSNLYGYVLGDPVNFVDPSGLWGVPSLPSPTQLLSDMTDAAGTAIGNAAGSAYSWANHHWGAIATYTTAAVCVAASGGACLMLVAGVAALKVAHTGYGWYTGAICGDDALKKMAYDVATSAASAVPGYGARKAIGRFTSFGFANGPVEAAVLVGLEPPAQIIDLFSDQAGEELGLPPGI